jgi:hypothetical protein
MIDFYLDESVAISTLVVGTKMSFLDEASACLIEPCERKE